MVRVFGEYEDGTESAKVRSGLAAAEEAWNEIYEAMAIRMDRLEELTPQILEAWQAFATAMVAHCWSNEITELSEDCRDERLQKRLVSWPTGIPVITEQ